MRLDERRQRHMSGRLCILVGIGLLCSGCASYEAEPLTPEAVNRALTPPENDALRVQAAALQHPILQPIDFNLADGLSPDEAAVLAVLVNPMLRAQRDKRVVAEAQLI